MPKLPTSSKIPTGMPRMGAKKGAGITADQTAADQVLEDMPVIDSDGSTELNSDDMADLSKEADLAQKYGDNPIEAFAEGAARGIVPGFDKLATFMGADPQRLREVKMRNEIASGVGEATGLVGGAVLSGGENVAADATLGGLATGAEKVTKSFVEKLFANQAEKTLGRKVLEKSLEGFAGAGVAGAGLGLNALLNENALGSADLNAENLLAYAGTGAVLNGLVGGAFGATEALAPVAKGAVDEMSGQLKRTFEHGTNPDTALAEFTGGTAKQQIEKIKFLEDAPKPLKDQFIKETWGLQVLDDNKTALSKFEAAADKLGESADKIYSKADEVANGQVIPIPETHSRLMDAVKRAVKENADKFDTQAAKNVENQVINSIGERFQRVWKNNVNRLESATEFRKAVQEWGTKGAGAFGRDADPKLVEILHAAMNSEARDILQANIERVTKGTPAEGSIEQLRNINKQFQMYYALKDGFEKKALGDKAFLSFKDSVLGVAGHAIAGNIGGLAAVAGKKLLESDLKRKFLILNTIERANLNGAKKVAESLKGFFEGAAKASSAMTKAVPRMSLVNSGFAIADKKKPENEEQAFKNIKENITQMTVNPDKLANKIAYNTMKAGYAAPNATKFAQVTLAKAVSFLYDKMPKEMANEQGLFAHEHQPSSMEMAKFQRYVQAVENPYSVLEELKAGTMTREHVETLQAVYPAIYSQIQGQALKFVEKHPDISYSKKIQIGTLLNVPTDFSLRPLSIANLQAGFQQQPQQPQGAVHGTVKGMKNLKLSDRHKTENERITAKED